MIIRIMIIITTPILAIAMVPKGDGERAQYPQITTMKAMTVIITTAPITITITIIIAIAISIITITTRTTAARIAIVILVLTTLRKNYHPAER